MVRQEIFGEGLFTRLILRELLDGTEERLEYLAKTVFKKPFALLNKLIADCANTPDPIMTAASVASLILGNYQIARVLPYLPGGGSERSTIDTVTQHVLMVLRATISAKQRFEEGSDLNRVWFEGQAKGIDAERES